MALTAEEFEGQNLKSLKTLVTKKIGVPRFRQRWLSEDHTELQEEAVMVASDVQLVVLDYVQAEDGDIQKLVHACKRNDVDQVDELLRKPLDPNVTGEHGMTALHHAAKSGHVECVALLLEAGANQDAEHYYQQTALQFAAGIGHLEVVRLLLEAGADKGRNYQSTALHLAALNGHLEVVRLLLAAGSMQDRVDFVGLTALDLAEANSHLQVVRLLREAAGKDVAG